MPIDLYSKIVSERGSLENLMSKLPGFGGYMEKASRREADRQLREHVATVYATQIARFGGIESEMVNAGGLRYMDRSKSIRTKLENLRRRILSDMPGYSGFLTSNKITEDDLARVYAFDQSMIDYAEAIATRLDALKNAANNNGSLVEHLSSLDATIQEANQAYDLRDDVLKGIN